MKIKYLRKLYWRAWIRYYEWRMSQKFNRRLSLKLDRAQDRLGSIEREP
jgi:hypothetical protein